MKVFDLLVEMPQMVPQHMFPFEKESQAKLRMATRGLRDAKEVYNHGDIRIMETDPRHLILFAGDQAIGLMDLSGPVDIDTNHTAWQVWNVYLLPEYRDKKLGWLMYNYVIRIRKEAFASGAAMTPASRRVYTSMLQDPALDVYALVDKKRVELKPGPQGLTTGDADMDDDAVFVARLK